MSNSLNVTIEVTEEEIKSAIERKLRQAITDQTTGYAVEKYIKDELAKKWKAVVDELIDEQLANSDILRAKISEEIVRKLRASLNVAMKSASKL